jgi:lysophospholipid hydrolase
MQYQPGNLIVLMIPYPSLIVSFLPETPKLQLSEWLLLLPISVKPEPLIIRILRMIASRVRNERDSSSNVQGRSNPSEFGANNSNLKTVAVLPVSRNVPIDSFARKLQAALEGIGASTAFLNQAIISSHLGRHAFTRIGKLKVSLSDALSMICSAPIALTVRRMVR